MALAGGHIAAEDKQRHHGLRRRGRAAGDPRAARPRRDRRVTRAVRRGEATPRLLPVEAPRPREARDRIAGAQPPPRLAADGTSADVLRRRDQPLALRAREDVHHRQRPFQPRAEPQRRRRRQFTAMSVERAFDDLPAGVAARPGTDGALNFGNYRF